MSSVMAHCVLQCVIKITLSYGMVSGGALVFFSCTHDGMDLGSAYMHAFVLIRLGMLDDISGNPQSIDLPTFGTKTLACHMCTLDFHGKPQVTHFASSHGIYIYIYVYLSVRFGYALHCQVQLTNHLYR